MNFFRHRRTPLFHVSPLSWDGDKVLQPRKTCSQTPALPWRDVLLQSFFRNLNPVVFPFARPYPSCSSVLFFISCFFPPFIAVFRVRVPAFESAETAPRIVHFSPSATSAYYDHKKRGEPPFTLGNWLCIFLPGATGWLFGLSGPKQNWPWSCGTTTGVRCKAPPCAKLGLEQSWQNNLSYQSRRNWWVMVDSSVLNATGCHSTVSWETRVIFCDRW